MSIVSVSSHQLYHDITATICMISHPEYVRHSVHYIYDIIPTMYEITTLCVDYTTLGICTTSFALLKPSHPLYHTKSQSLWLHIHFRHDWHHNPCNRHHTNCIFVITTSPLISHPLLNDITQTLCVTSYALYEHHIQSLCHHSTVLMTSQPLYMKPHPVCRATYTLYMRHHSHYLCPHTHCIDNITCILGRKSHSPYMWHRFHYARHHILTLWPKTTGFKSSQPIYLTSCPLYLCHHIHCIDHITPTVIMRSHPLEFTTSYPLYAIWHPLYDITTTAFMASDTLHITSPPGFMTCHPL